MYVYKFMVLLCKVHSHDLCNDEVKCTSQLIVLWTIELSEACHLHFKAVNISSDTRLATVYSRSSKHATCAASHRQTMYNYKSVIVRYNKVTHIRLSKFYPQ